MSHRFLLLGIYSSHIQLISRIMLYLITSKKSMRHVAKYMTVEELVDQIETLKANIEWQWRGHVGPLGVSLFSEPSIWHRFSGWTIVDRLWGSLRFSFYLSYSFSLLSFSIISLAVLQLFVSSLSSLSFFMCTVFGGSGAKRHLWMM